MTPRGASKRIDWGLFLFTVVGAQGYFKFIPLADQAARQIGLALAGAILVILVLRAPSRAIDALLSRPLVLFMAAWLLAAALISPRPSSSLFTATVLVLMVAYLCCRQETTEVTLQTFTLASSVSLVPSIVGIVIPLGPTVGYGGSARGFAGYFPFNSWAGFCAGVVVVGIAVLYAGGRFVWWHLPAFAAALFVLVMSRSATATIACIAGVSAAVWIATWSRTSVRIRPLIVVGLGLGVLSAIAFSNISLLPAVAEATGRDEKFTNRTVIWQQSLEAIRDSPYIGYGSGYWRTSYYWTSAQNGFLDIGLTAGVPVALALVVIVILAGWRLVRASSPLLPLWVFGVVVNLSVSQISSPTVVSLALWLAIASSADTAVSPTAREGAGVASDANDISEEISPRQTRATANRRGVDLSWISEPQTRDGLVVGRAR